MTDWSKTFQAPVLPENYVSRGKSEEIIAEIKAYKGGMPIIYLHGIGGYGKSTIASAICKYYRETNEDNKIAIDGVLWINLKNISDEDLCDKLLGQISMAEKGTEKKAFLGLEEARQYFNNNVLSNKRLVLVIDDVWKREHIKTFLPQGHDNVLRIFTGHNENYFGSDGRVIKFHINKMEADESLSLIAYGFKIPENCREPILNLAKKVGYYPVALTLINGGMHSIKTDDLGLEEVIEITRRQLDERGLTGLDENSSQENERDVAVKVTIENNLSHLNAEQRLMFSKLTIFPSSDNIDIGIVKKFLQKSPLSDYKTLQFIKTIAGLKFVYYSSNNTLSFNDIIFEYLKQNYHKPKFHIEFLNKLDAKSWRLWNETHNYLWENVIYHYIRGNKSEIAFSLLFDITFIAKKIIFTSTYSVENDFQLLRDAVDEVKKVRLTEILRRLSICTHLLAASKKNERQLLSCLKTRVFYDEGNGSLPIHFQFAEELPDNPSEELIRTFFGHEGRIYGCDIDRSGKRIVTASDDKKIFLWNTENGHKIQEFSEHTKRVFCVKISQDNRFILSGAADKKLILTNIGTTDSLIMPGHKGSIWACDLSSDNKLAISASEDKSVRVWNLTDGECIDVLEEHNAPVTGCRLFNDGEYIISSGHDNSVIIWKRDAGKYKVHNKLHDHYAAVWSCGISDGGIIISSSIDCSVRLWDLKKPEKKHLLGSHSGPVWGCDISADGKLGFSVSEDMQVKVWDIESKSLIKTLIGHSRYIWGVSYCLSKKSLLSCSLDATAKLWDLSIL